MSDPKVVTDPVASPVPGAMVQAVASSPLLSSPQIGASGGAKEKTPIQEDMNKMEEVGVGSGQVEKEPLPPEVEAWMKKTSQEEASIAQELSSLPKVVLPVTPTVQDDGPVFVLPLGESEMRLGLHMSVNDSWRWLATWAKRIFKQLNGKAVWSN